MTVSEMKKVTLLAEREYLQDVMLSLQNFQAVELIPTTADIQKGLVNKYLNIDDDTEMEQEDTSYDQIFENLSVESEITHLSRQLEDVEEYIEFLEETLPGPTLLERLRFEKDTYSLYEIEKQMEKLNVESLIEKAQALRNRINDLNNQKEKLEAERAFLTRWKSLDFNPKITENFKITETFVGAVDSERTDDLIESLNHFNETYLEELNYSEEETIFLVITSSQEAHDVENTLIRHRFERLHYHYDNLPSEELKRNKVQLEELQDKIAHVDEQPKEYKQLLNDLKIAEEFIYNKRERLRASEDVIVSDNLFILTGWIEDEEFDIQIRDLEKRVGKDKFLASVEEVRETEREDVPVKLKNKKSTAAFENVVEMYGLPKYGEIDPSGFVQPFTMLFFGMMTGDAGYGLLGLILITLAIKFMNFSSSVKKNLWFFGQLMVGTIIAGLAYGSFFGFQMSFQLIALNDQLIEAIGLSVGIGIIHLMIALGLNVAQNQRKGDYAQGYIDGLAWMLILIGASIMGVNLLVDGPAVWYTVGLGLIIINLLGVVLVSTFSAESKGAGLGQGLFGLMDITSYIGDILSYTRLTALGVAGANIGMAFNLIVGMLPPVARFTIGLLIFVGLHLFYMFISFISGYVHSLRLNFVEFFGKFHNGGGRNFSPISILEKNFIIKKDSI